MAHTIARELREMRDEAELVAVGSRTEESARAFAAAHDIRHACADPAAVARSEDVDILYVATPHPAHVDGILAGLRAGKAVLCEKPLTLNAREGARVVAESRQRGLFLMEALWTRFLPAIVALRRVLQDGAIGEIQLITGGGAFIPGSPETHYLLDRHRGGGVLLDAGVYLLSLTSMILGRPDSVLASAAIGPTSGVDERDAMILRHRGGAHALLYVSLHARRPPDFEILGTRGRIRLEAPVFRPASFTRWTSTGEQTTYDHPIVGSGYGYQLRAVMDAVRRGQRECEEMPLDESLAILATMDEIRRQTGVAYPGESS
jgi:predicted dehydrogenase